MAAAATGPAMGVAFIVYNLLYNTTVVRTHTMLHHHVTQLSQPL